MQPPIGCPTEGCLVTSSSTSYRHVSKTYPRKPPGPPAELDGIRHRLRLSKAAFARALGLSYPEYWRLVTGRVAVGTTILHLARFLAAQGSTTAPPPVPPPGPDSQGITLTPGSRCHWHDRTCRGTWWHFAARLDARTHVQGQACTHHLGILHDAVVDRLRARDARRTRAATEPTGP